MEKSKQKEKSVKRKKIIDADWKKEVEARVKEFSEGKIKTISYSKIKKENKIKFNF